MEEQQSPQELLKKWKWNPSKDEDLLDRGYIDLEGQFWPVLADSDDTTLTLCFRGAAKISDDGKHGWVIVTADPASSSATRICWRMRGEMLNDAQRETLIKIGLDPDNQSVKRDRSICYENVFPEDFSNLRAPRLAGVGE